LGRGVKFNPINRGFDFYYGHIVGARHFWPMERGPEHIVVTRGPGKRVKETKYLTYQLTDGAIEFIHTYKDDPFFLYVAYNAPHVPFEATDEDMARNSHIESEKRRTYAGMITALDDSVGRILKRLRDLELEENTLILFLSDNGSPTDARATLGYVDANNGPLRGSKGSLYEGGIRVPYIVQWKAGGLSEGTTYDRPVSSLDVLPTALAVAGATPPADLPGLNILPYLKGDRPNRDPVEALYWRYMGYHAVRAGDWKWVSDPKENVTGLFNLSTDVGEQNNLMQKHPEKAAELKSLWRKWNLNNAAPKWQPTKLNRLRDLYADEGMKSIE
jgi:arylsulfatase A-like enzyme